LIYIIKITIAVNFFSDEFTDSFFNFKILLNKSVTLRSFKIKANISLTIYRKRMKNNTCNVLLVDDSSTNTLLLESALKTLDFNISTAYSGEEALNLLKKKEFHLVLLDIMMPGMSGYDLMAELVNVEKNASTPVILVTASAKSQEEQKAKEMGAADYFEKPLDLETLITRVKELV